MCSLALMVQRTVGSVIPEPMSLKFLNNSDYLAIEPYQFQLNVYGLARDCSIVIRAVERYKRKFLFDDVEPSDRDDPEAGHRKQLGQLVSLDIDQHSNFVCESLPHYEMDESYSLRIVAEGQNGEASLEANTSWGILRGLETFSQLIFNYDSKYAVRTVDITDKPRFKHRGFMLDTARHYISLRKIKKLLDAMAFNKLNVFHWHMVDDQSFPYESSVFPQLSKKTSFRPYMTYTQKDVERIIKYAADRGIRVIPELDTPGHTYAMRYVPNLLTKCFNSKTGKPNGDFGPIDPTQDGSYNLVGELIKEFKNLFKDNFFHAGGDEVEFDCWASNPNVVDWMQKHGMAGDFKKLSTFYIEKVSDILSRNNQTMIVWQEMFDDGANLDKDAVVVHVWKNINNRPAFMKELKHVVSANYRALLSSCWYLNYIDYGQDWIKFYRCDPASKPIDENEEHLVLGGEICMWTEYVDDTNVLTRTWPRASAAAERLWSPKETVDEEKFLHRLEQMRCRLLSRGVAAEPVNGPGYC